MSGSDDEVTHIPGRPWAHSSVMWGEPAAEFARARRDRATHDITLKDVALAMNQLGVKINVSTISEWERGMSAPRENPAGKRKLKVWRAAMQLLVSTSLINRTAQSDRLSGDDGVTMILFEGQKNVED